MQHRYPTGGFTLIELMVTVSILAIMAAVGIPALQKGMDERRIKGASMNILSQLQHAQSQSSKTNNNIAFTPTTGSNWNIQIALQEDNDANTNDLIKIDSSEYKGTSLSAGGTTITFSSKRGEILVDGSALTARTLLLGISIGSMSMGITSDTTSQLRLCAANGLGGHPSCP